jgi:hypothetical protein
MANGVLIYVTRPRPGQSSEVAMSGKANAGGNS